MFKNMRTEGMSIMAKFRSSGMGNCGTRMRELSGMHALTVLSSKYMDFCQQFPIQELFYNALFANNLLASAAFDLPAEACSSGDRPNSTVHLVRRGSTEGGVGGGGGRAAGGHRGGQKACGVDRGLPGLPGGREAGAEGHC